jgi:hypothetical protein
MNGAATYAGPDFSLGIKRRLSFKKMTLNFIAIPPALAGRRVLLFEPAL